jgi:23S rRNA (cytidine1920-2'-O)/16S rRNA (cytidine1409-2'-O)-methyltransferase
MRVRLDKLLLDRKLASSRQKAQALILEGRVLVNGQKVDKAGAGVDAGARIELLGSEPRYVSRGGLKLEAGLGHWNIDTSNLICVDVGASTGGFTDCLLQHGAAAVIAVDTGYGQIDLRLRQDPRVRLLERSNARYLRPEDIGTPADLVVMDLSFISATLVLPSVVAAAFPDAGRRAGKRVIVLVKPQFEAGREQVGKGGIVRDAAAQAAAVEKVRRCLVELGCGHTDAIESPILGGEGNREFLLYGEF